ncbi:uncharacterized protein YoaH (UPF0181 family) [Paenibacillus sp. 4624]|jgi:uncharacterized protein YoaH (UPF0181 family)|uniref:DUF2564 family protein n=1 Tax=Paenibacillus amylolyticus TaxID=1451 RepID=A0A5M9WSE5_PAEAM|nr:hypothetical protein [Paenibacillus amylolyticus]KAA8784399.1 hypothetical protein EC604_11135 [Paenibacillus amylolyticus]
MPKRYDSSLQASTTVSQAQNAVNKLHYAVSQAMSHPNAQTIVQAEQRLAHTEQAMKQAELSLGGQGFELAQEMFIEEKKRLHSLQNQHRQGKK